MKVSWLQHTSRRIDSGLRYILTRKGDSSRTIVYVSSSWRNFSIFLLFSFLSFVVVAFFFLRNIFNHRRTTIVDKEMFIKMTCQSTKIIFDERDYAKVSHKKRQYHAIVVQLYIANITCYFNKNLISRISVNKQLLESINRFFFKRLLNDRNKLSQSPIVWKLLSR